MREWSEIYKEKRVSQEEAAAVIKSGDVIGLSPGCSAPVEILEEIALRCDELEDVTFVSGLLLQPFEFLKEQYSENFNHISIFPGPFERAALKQKNVSVIPLQFSRFNYLMDTYIKNNVAILECSPPDRNGYMSFGPLGSLANQFFIKNATKVIVQVNAKTPYLYGPECFLHVRDVDYICETDRNLAQIPVAEAREAEKSIASYIVNEIPNGSTLQLGIGSIADAVGSQLEEKNDLGVHTEMLTNSMVNLAKKGVINCSKKNFHPNKITYAFGMGMQEMYEFMHKNQMFESCPAMYVNDPRNIGRNDNFMSINSTLSVDLTGQVCSESIGFRQYSGTGGQLDFVRGSRYSKGGKSFIALLSTADTKDGKVSKISSSLLPGTVVTTPRTDTMYVVTEYGIANLWGKSIAERVEEMIAIAHPDFRDQLTQEAKEVQLI